MTRRLALVALWLAATVVAILMATFAVRLVGDNVVADGPATVTRGEVEADLSTVPGTSVVDPATTAVTAPPESVATRPSPSTAVPSASSPTPTPTPTPITPATTAAPGGAAPPAIAPGGDDPAPATTAAPPITAAPPVEQSFPLVGGSVRVRCAGDTASLVSSSPNPGYAMEVRSTGPDRVEVRFTGAEHTSELKSWCSGGAVAAEPKESGQGDGGRD